MKNKAGGLCSHTPFHFTILSYLSLEGDRFFSFFPSSGTLDLTNWTTRSNQWSAETSKNVVSPG